MLLSRHGIAWELEGDVQTARYANGDIAVLGPVRLVHTLDSGALETVSMANPKPGERQGFTAKNQWLASSYDASLAVQPGTVLMPGTSLVTVSVRDAAEQTPQLERAAVLTVVSVLPEDGQEFRPAYAGPIKGPRRRLVDLENPALHLDFPEAGNFDPSKIEALWPDFLWEWGGRFLHPAQNMPDYGRDMACTIGSAMLSLFFGTDPETVRRTLIALVQIGIDMHGCYINGGRWTAMGGHSHGRLAPILLASLALRDPSMTQVDPLMFAEGNQSFYITQDSSTGVINAGNGGYTPADVGLPEWAHSHGQWPHLDNPSWSDADNPYRFCCSANAWLAQLTALRLLGLVRAFGHDAAFDYLDRYVRRCIAEGVPGWWIYYQSPWHLDAYQEFRLHDAPGTRTFGHGRYVLLADIPAQQGESFRVRVRGPYPAKVLLAVGPAALLPTTTPALPPGVSLPPGITFRGRNYLERIDASVSFDHLTNETIYDVPSTPFMVAGTEFTIQAFAVHADGSIDSSNAMMFTVQAPLVAPGPA